MSQSKFNQSYLSETGVVVKTDGEFAWVKTQRQTACGNCESSQSCGTSSLAKLFSSVESQKIKVKNPLAAHAGQSVRLTLDESVLVKHAFMAYGLPLAGLFAGAIGGEWLMRFLTGYSGEWVMIFGAMLGIFCGWFYTRRFYCPAVPEIEAIVSD